MTYTDWSEALISVVLSNQNGKKFAIINLKYMNLYQKNILSEKISPVLPRSLSYLVYSVTSGSEEFTTFLNQYLSALYRLGIQATVFKKQLLK